ncbi:MAG: 30S ribosomal protein S20 [Lysobacterales bacterium]|nr:MAG: 30S ribosomal protein S20 [Xanthomonadales bacterium]
MANSRQSRKRASQSEARRMQNVGMRSKMRTFIKKVVKAIESGDKKADEGDYRDAVPLIDNSAGRNMMHANKAARHKSRLNARIRAMTA